MRVLLIVVSLFALSCNSKVAEIKVSKSDTLIANYDKLNLKCDSLSQLIFNDYDSLRLVNDSLIKLVKRQKQDLFAAKYKIGRVQYRIKICEKNPALKKFFYGWTRRIVAN